MSLSFPPSSPRPFLFPPSFRFPPQPLSALPLTRGGGGGCRRQRNTAKRPLTNSRGDIISRSRWARTRTAQLTSVYGWICPVPARPAWAVDVLQRKISSFPCLVSEPPYILPEVRAEMLGMRMRMYVLRSTKDVLRG